jgi:hypothetical protein
LSCPELTPPCKKLRCALSKVKLVPDFDKKVGWSEGYSTKMVAGGKKLNHLLEKDST